tara:strand:- start:43 stop:348 length:306 start_codon:yes stop_codon:yes gene_type:complete
MAANYLCSKCKKPSCKCARYSQKHRTSPAKRGYGRMWQRARLVYLKANPLCKTCSSKGKTRQATVVDHIIPHRDDIKVFWDTSNWQPLCIWCHNSKTARGQ